VGTLVQISYTPCEAYTLCLSRGGLPQPLET